MLYFNSQIFDRIIDSLLIIITTRRFHLVTTLASCMYEGRKFKSSFLPFERGLVIEKFFHRLSPVFDHKPDILKAASDLLALDVSARYLLVTKDDRSIDLIDLHTDNNKKPLSFISKYFLVNIQPSNPF